MKLNVILWLKKKVYEAEKEKVFSFHFYCIVFGNGQAGEGEGSVSHTLERKLKSDESCRHSHPP